MLPDFPNAVAAIIAVPVGPLEITAEFRDRNPEQIKRFEEFTHPK